MAQHHQVSGHRQAQRWPSSWSRKYTEPAREGPASADSWWRHQIATFSALLAICAGNSPVTGEFPAQRPVKRSFDVFFDLRLSKRLSKQPWCWWFETSSRPLWRHCNVYTIHSKNYAQCMYVLLWVLWLYEEFCAASGYQGQGQVITSNSNCVL